MTSAIIVAAGTSRRMGFDKLFADLDGHPVLWRTLLAFQACDAIDEIILVTSAEKRPDLLDWEINPDLPKLTGIVEGGAERQDSVAAGLASIDPAATLVAVHDGARPLVTPDLITRCVKTAARHRAATAARRVTDTVKHANDNNIVTGSVDRTGLWAMETPQVFHAALLANACRAVTDQNLDVTDEVSAVEHLDVPIHLVDNPVPNPKITFPADLELAHAILNMRPQDREG